MTSDSFVVKTHARLTELSAAAKQARRAHNRPGCICVNCSKVTAIHEQMNDYLDQLEGITPVDMTALAVAYGVPADTSRVEARYCTCGALRFSGSSGYLRCVDCDFGPDAKWHSTGFDHLDAGEAAEEVDP